MNHGCIVTTSWDDGHKLDLKLARLLLRYKIQGTFYVPIHYLGDESLSEDDLMDISRHFEIGAHTLTHPSLTEIPIYCANLEIVESKKALEDITGQKIYGFCYPNGAYNSEIIKLVQRAGYVYARTSRGMSTVISDPYQMDITVYVDPLCVRNILKTMGVMNRSTLKRMRAATGGMGWRKSSIWLAHARLLFEYVRATGGIWHLSGHSWEIEKNGMWDDLETLLQYISGRKDVLYLTNYEVVRGIFYKRNY